MMKTAAISLGVCVALFSAVTAQAQNVAAGARAVVAADTLPVHAAMSESSEVRATLKRGDSVVIGLVLFGSEITWCAVSRAGENKRLGFASCEFLEPDRSPATAAAPAPAGPAPMPVMIRPAAPVSITGRQPPTILSLPPEAPPNARPADVPPPAQLVVRTPALPLAPLPEPPVAPVPMPAD